MSEARIIEAADGADDPRRHLPIGITWRAGLVGRITVGGEYWGEVEWSERRQAWCIEDVTGACLTHASGIHGKAATKEAAVALAREMILDGRMPSPQEAQEAWRAGEPERERQREKRRQQPAQIRRREATRAAGRRGMPLGWRSIAPSSSIETSRHSKRRSPRPSTSPIRIYGSRIAGRCCGRG